MDKLGSYSQTEVAGMDEAELESRALIKTASALNKVKESWGSATDNIQQSLKEELHQALDKNRRLWSVLAAAMQEDDCPQPPEIRQNILNLASFIFRRTLEVSAHPAPEKLDILIDINMNIARGLAGKAE